MHFTLPDSFPEASSWLNLASQETFHMSYPSNRNQQCQRVHHRTSSSPVPDLVRRVLRQTIHMEAWRTSLNQCGLPACIAGRRWDSIHMHRQAGWLWLGPLPVRHRHDRSAGISFMVRSRGGPSITDSSFIHGASTATSILLVLGRWSGSVTHPLLFDCTCVQWPATPYVHTWWMTVSWISCLIIPSDPGPGILSYSSHMISAVPQWSGYTYLEPADQVGRDDANNVLNSYLVFTSAFR